MHTLGAVLGELKRLESRDHALSRDLPRRVLKIHHSLQLSTIDCFDWYEQALIARIFPVYR